MMPFGARLLSATQQRGRLCVGIDPHPELLDKWGLTQDIDGLKRFTLTCVEAFAGESALVKPQVAFYEAYGSSGFSVLETALAYLKQSQTLSLVDVKRGDIGSTMSAYAHAWLSSDSPLAADAMTVSPYLGVGSLEPAFALAQRTGRGVFVLGQTSNPEGGEVQLARLYAQTDARPPYAGADQPHVRNITSDSVRDDDHSAAGSYPVAPKQHNEGKKPVFDDQLSVSQGFSQNAFTNSDSSMTVAQSIVNEGARRNQVEYQNYGCGSVGIVVGATVQNAPDLALFGGPILLPGVGAQGGTPEDVAQIVGANNPLAIPAVSRAILKCGPRVSSLRSALHRWTEHFL